jgi:hypothetical protein
METLSLGAAPHRNKGHVDSSMDFHLSLFCVDLLWAWKDLRYEIDDGGHHRDGWKLDCCERSIRGPDRRLRLTH